MASVGHPSPRPDHVGDPSPVCVELLNHFRVRVGDTDVTLPASAERIVAYLAITDRAQPRDGVTCMLWPDRGDADALATVRRALWRLNRDVPGLVERSGQYLSIGSSVDVDVRAVITATTAAAEPSARIDVDLVRSLTSDLLPHWPDHWLDGPRESLRQRRLHKLEDMARCYLDGGNPGDALTVALAAADLDPLRESAHRIVICAHLLEDNSAAAMQQFRNYRELLWHEMQLRPSKQLHALVAEACGSPRYTDPLRERVQHVHAGRPGRVHALHQVHQ